MSEYLSVDGIGRGRVDALRHADLQAASYFGLEVSAVGRLDREIGRCSIVSHDMDGTAAVCCVRVEYRNPQDEGRTSGA